MLKISFIHLLLVWAVSNTIPFCVFLEVFLEYKNTCIKLIKSFILCSFYSFSEYKYIRIWLFSPFKIACKHNFSWLKIFLFSWNWVLWLHLMFLVLKWQNSLYFKASSAASQMHLIWNTWSLLLHLNNLWKHLAWPMEWSN